MYVGLYSVASKVTALLKQLLGAVIVVTVPRLACLYGQKGGEFFQKLARQIADLDFAPAAGAALATLLADLVTCLACYFCKKIAGQAQSYCQKDPRSAGKNRVARRADQEKGNEAQSPGPQGHGHS